MANFLLNSLVPSLLHPYVEREGLIALSSFVGSEIRLENLVIKPSALDQLHLPIDVKYGRIGSVVIEVPGGLLRWFFTRSPIRVIISDVHVLIDKRSKARDPENADLAKSQALALDAHSYRQTVLDRVLAAMLATGVAAPSITRSTLVESVLRDIKFEVHGVHVRYEESSGIPASRFAAGLTFASLVSAPTECDLGMTIPSHDSRSMTASHEGAATSLSASTSQSHVAACMERRSARISLLTIYWDPLDSEMSDSTRMAHVTAFPSQPGPALTAAFTAGIMTRDVSAAYHHYVLHPTSPRLDIQRCHQQRLIILQRMQQQNITASKGVLVTPAHAPHDRDMGTPVATADAEAPELPPALSLFLSVSQLEFTVNRSRLLQLAALHCWSVEQDSNNLREVLRLRLRPPAVLPWAPRAWFRYAVRFIIALRRYQNPHAVGRWDFSRVRGALYIRRTYINAYRKLVEFEENLFTAAATRGADVLSSTLTPTALSEALRRDPRTAEAMRVVADIEGAVANVSLEALLDYRLEARLEAEEARSRLQRSPELVREVFHPDIDDADAVKSNTTSSRVSGWLSWFAAGTVSAPVVGSKPKGGALSSQIPSFDSTARREELRLNQSLLSTSRNRLRLDVKLELRNLRVCLLGPLASSKLEGVTRECTQHESRFATLTISGGTAHLRLRCSGAWSVDVALKSLTMVDDISAGTLLRRVVGPPCSVPLSQDDSVLPSSSVPSLLTLAAEHVHVERSHRCYDIYSSASTGDSCTVPLTRLCVESSPIDVIVTPVLVRAFAAFVAASPVFEALGSGVTAQLATLQNSAPRDLLALLANRTLVDVNLQLSAPTVILVVNPADEAAQRCAVRLGKVCLRTLQPSTTDNATSRNEWPPQVLPPPHLTSEFEAMHEFSSDRSCSSTIVAGDNIHHCTPASSPLHNQQMVGTQSAWELELSCMSLEIQLPSPKSAFHVDTLSVIDPVTLKVVVWLSVPPFEPHGLGALRFKACLTRLTVATSLCFAKYVSHLGGTVNDLFADIATDVQRLHVVDQPVYHIPTATPRMPKTKARGAHSDTTLVAPVCVMIDLRIEDLTLRVHDASLIVDRIRAASLDPLLVGGSRSTYHGAIEDLLAMHEHAACTMTSHEFVVSLGGVYVSCECFNATILARASLDSIRINGSRDGSINTSCRLSVEPDMSCAASNVEAGLFGVPLLHVIGHLTSASPTTLVAQVTADHIRALLCPTTVADLQLYFQFMLACLMRKPMRRDDSRTLLQNRSPVARGSKECATPHTQTSDADITQHAPAMPEALVKITRQLQCLLSPVGSRSPHGIDIDCIVSEHTDNITIPNEADLSLQTCISARIACLSIDVLGNCVDSGDRVGRIQIEDLHFSMFMGDNAISACTVEAGVGSIEVHLGADVDGSTLSPPSQPFFALIREKCEQLISDRAPAVCPACHTPSSTALHVRYQSLLQVCCCPVRVAFDHTKVSSLIAWMQQVFRHSMTTTSSSNSQLPRSVCVDLRLRHGSRIEIPVERHLERDSGMLLLTLGELRYGSGPHYESRDALYHVSPRYDHRSSRADTSDSMSTPHSALKSISLDSLSVDICCGDATTVVRSRLASADGPIQVEATMLSSLTDHHMKIPSHDISVTLPNIDVSLSSANIFTIMDVVRQVANCFAQADAYGSRNQDTSLSAAYPYMRIEVDIPGSFVLNMAPAPFMSSIELAIQNANCSLIVGSPDAAYLVADTFFGSVSVTEVVLDSSHVRRTSLAPRRPLVIPAAQFPLSYSNVDADCSDGPLLNQTQHHVSIRFNLATEPCRSSLHLVISHTLVLPSSGTAMQSLVASVLSFTQSDVIGSASSKASACSQKTPEWPSAECFQGNKPPDATNPHSNIDCSIILSKVDVFLQPGFLDISSERPCHPDVSAHATADTVKLSFGLSVTAIVDGVNANIVGLSSSVCIRIDLLPKYQSWLPLIVDRVERLIGSKLVDVVDITVAEGNGDHSLLSVHSGVVDVTLTSSAFHAIRSSIELIEKLVNICHTTSNPTSNTLQSGVASQALQRLDSNLIFLRWGRLELHLDGFCICLQRVSESDMLNIGYTGRNTDCEPLLQLKLDSMVVEVDSVRTNPTNDPALLPFSNEFELRCRSNASLNVWDVLLKNWIPIITHPCTYQLTASFVCPLLSAPCDSRYCVSRDGACHHVTVTTITPLRLCFVDAHVLRITCGLASWHALYSENMATHLPRSADFEHTLSVPDDMATDNIQFTRTEPNVLCTSFILQVHMHIPVIVIELVHRRSVDRCAIPVIQAIALSLRASYALSNFAQRNSTNRIIASLWTFSLSELHAFNNFSCSDRNDDNADPSFFVFATTTPHVDLLAIFQKFGTCVSLSDSDLLSVALPTETPFGTVRYLHVSEPELDIFRTTLGYKCDDWDSHTTSACYINIESMHVELNSKPLCTCMTFIINATSPPLPASLRTCSSRPLLCSAASAISLERVSSRTIINLLNLSMSVNRYSCRNALHKRLASVEVSGFAAKFSRGYTKTIINASLESFVIRNRLADPLSLNADFIVPVRINSRKSAIEQQPMQPFLSVNAIYYALSPVDNGSKHNQGTSDTIVTMHVAPVRAVYFALHVEEILDVLNVGIGRLFVSSARTATNVSPVDHDETQKHDNTQFIELSAAFERVQCIIPTDINSNADAVVVQLENVTMQTSVDRVLGCEAAKRRLGVNSDATCTALSLNVGPDAGDKSIILPIFVFTIKVQSGRVGIRAQNSPLESSAHSLREASTQQQRTLPVETVCEIDSTTTHANGPYVFFKLESLVPVTRGSWYNEWATSGFSIPAEGMQVLFSQFSPLRVTLTARQLSVILHLLWCHNDACSPKEVTTRQRHLSNHSVSHLDHRFPVESSTVSDVIGCSVCSRSFGGMVAARACQFCQRACCISCIAGYIFDEEALIARESCRACYELCLNEKSDVTDVIAPGQAATARDVTIRKGSVTSPCPLIQVLWSLNALTVILLQQGVGGERSPLVQMRCNGATAEYAMHASTDSRTSITIEQITVTEAHASGSTLAPFSSAAHVIVARDPRMSRGVDGSSLRQLELCIYTNSSYSIIDSSTPTLPSVRVDAVLWHCDFHADLVLLQPILRFATHVHQQYLDRLSASVDAPTICGSSDSRSPLNTESHMLLLRPRSIPQFIKLTVTLHRPRIVMLEAPARPASRALMLSLSSVVLTSSTITEWPHWGLVLTPSGAFDSRVLRSRTQVERSAHSVAFQGLELLTTHLLPVSAQLASEAEVGPQIGFVFSGERTSLLSACDWASSAALTRALLLSIEKTTAARTQNVGDTHSFLDTSRGLASTPRPSEFRLHIETPAVPCMTLAFSDWIMVSRIIARFSPNPDSEDSKPELPKPSALSMPLAQEKAAATPTNLSSVYPPSGSIHPLFESPRFWHANDVEVLLPHGIELGLTVTQANATLHAGASGTDDSVPLLIIERITNASATSSARHDTGAGSGVHYNASLPSDLSSRDVLRPGDILLAIDGVDVTALGLKAALSLLRKCRKRASPVLLRVRALTQECQVSLGGIHVALVDDSVGVCRPLFLLRLGRVDAVLRRSTETAYASASLRGLRMCFHNPRLLIWEPIVERFDIDVTLASVHTCVDAPLSMLPAPSATVKMSADGDWVEVPPSLPPSINTYGSPLFRPRRVVMTYISSVEINLSHASLLTLSAALTSLRASAEREFARNAPPPQALPLGRAISGDLAENSISDVVAIMNTTPTCTDLAAVAMLSPRFPGARMDSDVLQATGLTYKAFPLHFHNASGLSVVLAIYRDTGSLAQHWAVLLSMVTRDVLEAEDAAAPTTGASRESATDIEDLLAAASARTVCGGNAACIAIPPGGSIGWITAPNRDTLGILTTNRILGTLDSTESVFTPSLSCPPLGVFIGSSSEPAVYIASSDGPSPTLLAVKARLGPRNGASSVQLQLRMTAPAPGRRVFILRSCIVMHNACGIALEVWLRLRGDKSTAGAHPIGVVAARSSLALPAHLTQQLLLADASTPGTSARRGEACIHLRPLPLGSATTSAATAYGLSAPLPLFSPSTVACELECRASAESERALGCALPPFYLAGQIRRDNAAAPLIGILLHAPLMLTNALPVPLEAEVACATAGSLVTAAHCAMIAAGEALEIYAASGGPQTGCLLQQDGRTTAATEKPDPVLRVRVGGLQWPAEWVLLEGPSNASAAGVDAQRPPLVHRLALLPLEAGLVSPPAQLPPPLVLLCDVRRIRPWLQGEEFPAARRHAAAAGGRLDVTCFVPAFVTNHSDLPLLLGEPTRGAVRAAGADSDDDGDAANAGGGWDLGLLSPDPDTALPAEASNGVGGHLRAVALGVPGSIVASAHQGCVSPAPLAVADEVWQHERFDHVAGWRAAWLYGEPPHWADATGSQALTREAVSSRLPRGWRWSGPWVAGPWDHTARFQNFRTAAHAFHAQRRPRDHTRRRRWSRIRVRTDSEAPQPLPLVAGVPLAPGVTPGHRVVLPEGPGGLAPMPSQPPMLAWGDRDVGLAERAVVHVSAAVALCSAAPRVCDANDSATDAVSSLPIVSARLLSGDWSPAVDTSELGVSCGEVLRLSGPPHAIPTRGSSNSDLGDMEATTTAPSCPRFDLAIDAESLPPPFHRSRCISIRPLVTLVNGTSAALRWRQADAPGAPEHILAPLCAAPVWWDSMPMHDGSDNPSAPSVQFSPAAALGGWSPPVQLTIAGALAPPLQLRAAGERRVAIAVPITSVSAPPYVRSLLVSRSVLGAVVLGVMIRTDPRAPAGSAAVLAVVGMQSPPLAPLRPPPSVLGGGAIEREAVARAWAADLDTAPPVAPDRTHPPFITIVNHSRYVLAWRQRAARAFSSTGTPFHSGAQRDAEAQLAALLALAPARASPLTAPGDPLLGVTLAGALFFAPPHTVTPMALVDADAGVHAAGENEACRDFDPASAGAGAPAEVSEEARTRHIRAREEMIVALVDESGDCAAGPFGILRLQRLGRCLLLLGRPSSAHAHPSLLASSAANAAVLRVTMRGRDVRVTVHDAESLGVDLMTLLVAATPGGVPREPAEDFAITPEAIDAAVMRLLGPGQRPNDWLGLAAASLADDALSALTWADAAPWHGAPYMPRSGVRIQPAADEPAWHGSIVATEPPFTLPPMLRGSRAPLLEPPFLWGRTPPCAPRGQAWGAGWDTSFRLRMSSVGLSLVHSYDDPREVAYCRLHGVAASLMQTRTAYAWSVRAERLLLDDPSYAAEMPLVVGSALAPASDTFETPSSTSAATGMPASSAEHHKLPHILAELVIARTVGPATRWRGFRVLRGSLDVQPLRLCISARWAIRMLRVARDFSAAVSEPLSARSFDSPLSASPRSNSAADVMPLLALTRTRPRDSAAAAAALAVALCGNRIASNQSPLSNADAAAAALWLSRGSCDDDAGPLDFLLYVESVRVGAVAAIVDLRLESDADLQMLLPPLFARLAAALPVPVRGARLGFAFAAVEHAVRTSGALCGSLLAAILPQARRQWAMVLEAMGGVGAPVALARALTGTGRSGSTASPSSLARRAAGHLRGPGHSLLGGVAGLTGLASSALAAAATVGSGRAAAADASLGFRASAAALGGSRPEGISSGVAHAAEQLVGGLLGGVGGLFTKTAHGLRTGTLEGALTGAAAGVAGVILSPLAGATGAAASLLAGAEQALRPEAAKAADAGRLQRARAPRVFMGHAGAVVPYRADLAELLLGAQTAAARADLVSRIRYADAAAGEGTSAADFWAQPASASNDDGGTAPLPGTIERVLRCESLLDGTVLLLTSRRAIHMSPSRPGHPTTGIIWAAPVARVRCAVDRGSTFRLLLADPSADAGPLVFAFADPSTASLCVSSLRRAAAAIAIESKAASGAR